MLRRSETIKHRLRIYSPRFVKHDWSCKDLHCRYRGYKNNLMRVR